jgi:uncharacterized protein
MFVLIDEQPDAYDYVLHAVERGRPANDKTSVIISGGPGFRQERHCALVARRALATGPNSARQGRTVMHATGSQSFTHTLRKVAGARVPKVQKMFAGSTPLRMLW